MGYIGASMSERAAAAYDNGLLPASKLAKKLGVSAAAIRAVLPSAEWHHTSKHYNATAFFSAPEEDEPTEVELLEKMRAFDAAARAEKKATADIQHGLCAVGWIEWGGSRNRPTADRQVVWADVVERGDWFIIQRNGFQPFRMKSSKNGLRIRQGDGKVLANNDTKRGLNF